MTTPTAAEIKARYPELSTITDPVVNVAIADAVPWFDETRWGSFFAQGFAAFVAHMLMVDARAASGGGTGSPGAIASKTVGNVSVSYAQVQFTKATDAFYATTSYGQSYLRLRRLVGTGALAV